MITSTRLAKVFSLHEKAYFGKKSSLFYYIKHIDNILPLSVQLWIHGRRHNVARTSVVLFFFRSCKLRCCHVADDLINGRIRYTVSLMYNTVYCIFNIIIYNSCLVTNKSQQSTRCMNAMMRNIPLYASIKLMTHV